MFTTGNWISIIGIIIVIFIGVWQYNKRSAQNKSTITINQKSGILSKGEQKINISGNQKNDGGQDS
jgi:hypothetical protein